MNIKKCIALKRARDAKKGVKNSVFQKDIGRKFFPNANDKTAQESISRLPNNLFIKKEWVEILCKECEVDPNFVFGFKSKHDRDYFRLVEDTSI